MSEAAKIILAKLSSYPDHGATGLMAVYTMTGPELGTILDELERRPHTGGEESVGTASAMPGSNGGFTMAVFKASDVPEGTKLYVAPPTAWKPIETAPRDGTELIGFRPDQGVFAFRWAWMEEFVPKDQNGDPTEDYDETFAWWWHDRWNWMEGELTPTHWMPLPAEPVQQQEGA